MNTSIFAPGDNPVFGGVRPENAIDGESGCDHDPYDLPESNAFVNGRAVWCLLFQKIDDDEPGDGRHALPDASEICGAVVQFVENIGHKIEIGAQGEFGRGLLSQESVDIFEFFKGRVFTKLLDHDRRDVQSEGVALPTDDRSRGKREKSRPGADIHKCLSAP